MSGRLRRMEGGRKSGRTQRALHEAIELAYYGGTVLLVMATKREAVEARQFLLGLVHRATAASRITVEYAQGGMLPGTMRYTQVIVDHRVYEWLLDAWDAKMDTLEKGRGL